ncbi:hypothetical protein [Rhodobacter ferrooxidans]|uniref:DUF3617 family protein n=1 Tax=Rhodobacter ferrooxidans TaxID=371731 RepID=C8S047_9RHOB|nr:hypothetical protein [Rhodobacter sp. SW2]EEW25656.1 hypothetical protein Rsw2DRAFT_1425 [Rhodobacter sp. SW2]
MKLVIFALFGFFAAPALAQQTYPWEGTWAYDPAACASPGKGSYTLTATEAVSPQQRCTLHDITAIGPMQAWQHKLRCKTEDGMADLPRLMLLEGPDALWIWAGSGAPLRYSRCPG